MKRLLLCGAAAAALADGALAEPTGQAQTLRAERARVERLRDEMEAVLETTPGGRGVVQSLRANIERKAADMPDAAPARPAPQAERDPFAVTPQLRAGGGRSPGYIKAMPGTALGEAPPMALKGVAGEAGRRMALIQVKDHGLVRVREGTTFQLFGNQAFRVKSIREDAVVLENGHAEAEFLLVR